MRQVSPPPSLSPPHRRAAVSWLALLVLTALVAGCTAVLDTTDYGFREAVNNRVLEGMPFTHRTVFKPGEGRRLNVYIEGDGRPWATRVTRAEDPTPRRALMLDLMSQDPGAALFLGRPCYFLRSDTHCDSDKWWTSHRYAQEVVDSMAAVLDQFAGDYDSLQLIGHSGGGTLAYLLAAQRPEVTAVVTLAANLNLTLWARDHRYAPLYGSKNPLEVTPLPPRIRQYHFLGSLDANVRPEIIESVVSGQPSAQLTIVAGVDHVCCWASLWPELLAQLDAGG